MEQELREGAERNLDGLINSEDIKYARCLAHRFFSSRSNSVVDIDDVVSSAYLGLCQAATKYSEDKVDSLKTYSYMRIKGSMYECLKDNGGLSRNEYRKIYRKDSQDENKKEAYYNMANSLSELSQLGSLIEEWGMSIHVNKDYIVDISYSDEVLTEEKLCRKSLYLEIHKALNSLSYEVRKVIYDYYFKGKTFSAIQSDFPDKSKSYICRVHKRGLRLLREKLRNYVVNERILN